MNAPTKAAEVLHSLMQEENWNAKDLEAATGLSYSTVGRWLDGSTNPSPKRIADVLVRVGRDPSRYGVAGPRVVAPTAFPTADGEPPDWARQILEQQTELLKIVKRIEGRL